MQKVFAAANLVEISPSNTAPELTQGRTGSPATRPAPSRPTSVPPSPMRYRAASPPTTSTRPSRRRRSSSSTTSRPTAPASPASSPRSTRKRAARSSAPTTSTWATRTRDPRHQVKNSGAELLYYGGQYDESQVLTKQLKDAGAKIPLMGGDGMFTPDLHQDRRQGRRGRPRHLRRRPGRHPAGRQGIHRQVQVRWLQGRLRHLRRLLLRRRHRHHHAIGNVVKDGKRPPPTPARRSSTRSRRSASKASQAPSASTSTATPRTRPSPCTRPPRASGSPSRSG